MWVTYFFVTKSFDFSLRVGYLLYLKSEDPNATL